MNLRRIQKIKDSVEAEKYAESAIDLANIYELYTEGEIVIGLPSGIPQDEFVKAAIARVTDLWNDAEADVGTHYGAADFTPRVVNNTLVITATPA